MNHSLLTTFSQHTLLGEVSLVPLSLTEHSAMMTQWVNLPYAQFWGMQHYSQQQVHQAYHAVLDKPDKAVYIGLVNQHPQFLLECYDPKHDIIADHYSVEMGDLGMHILIAPAQQKIHHFSWQIMATVMEFMFSHSSVQRIVVEPDHRNHKIHQLNKRVGFVHQKKVDLGHKHALLAFCDQAQFQQALQIEQAKQAQTELSPAQAIQPIQSSIWQQATLLHIRKCLSELSHERILEPELVNGSAVAPWSSYQVVSDDGEMVYVFSAQELALTHWVIDAASIRKYHQRSPCALDSVAFILEFQSRLAIPQSQLFPYLEEINSTLYSSAYKLQQRQYPVTELIHTDFQQIEIHMTEGHPSFIANNGRIGFDRQDFYRYAPEAGSPIQLIWLAVHREHSLFVHIDEVNQAHFLEKELELSLRESFQQQLIQLSLDQADYYWLPVHPWQWFNQLAVTYADEIAQQAIVCLGYGDDYYLAQQSIRTLFNISYPDKAYVKTALSITNMGFIRGLSADYMAATPAINQWLQQLVEQDNYLQQKQMKLLKEVAAIGYRHSHTQQTVLKDNPYRKMLAALWRESPQQYLQPQQQLMTMAALLHRDHQQQSMICALITASGLSTADWLSAYFSAYFAPLLHCYYQYDLVFMPHGENIILILEHHVPMHMLMKDLAEEICVINGQQPLPPLVQRIATTMPIETKLLSIFTDIFDGVFRYIAAILYEQQGFAETEFWSLVASCVHQYQQAHPHLQEKFNNEDIFTPYFTHSCLNRLQLANRQQMVDLADPAKNLQFVGQLANPIAAFK